MPNDAVARCRTDDVVLCRVRLVVLSAVARADGRGPRADQSDAAGCAECDLQPGVSWVVPVTPALWVQLVAGRTNAEIARDLFVSHKTVSVHVTNLMRKTGTTNRIEAAALARRLGES